MDSHASIASERLARWACQLSDDQVPDPVRRRRYACRTSRARARSWAWGAAIPPVCLSSHAAADALGELMARYRFSADDVVRIVCDVPDIVVANLRYGVPDTPEQARFSMPFAMAATLQRPDWGLAAMAPHRLAQDGLRGLMRRVDMVTGPHWNDADVRRRAPEGAQVRVALRDGRVLQASKDKAVGNPREPLGESRIARKFLDCAMPAVGAGRAERLLETLHGLDSALAIQTLFDGLA